VYNLWNLNSTLVILEYCHWWKDSWPLEKFVVYFCFQSSFVVDFKVKVKGRSRLLSVSSSIYFKLIWIDEMQIITESKIVQLQNMICIRHWSTNRRLKHSFTKMDKTRQKTSVCVTRTPLKTGVELRCLRRVSSSCSASDISC
jgi:hypothetical protein